MRFATGYEYGKVATFTTRPIDLIFSKVDRNSKEFFCEISEIPRDCYEEVGFLYSKSSNVVDENSEKILGGVNNSTIVAEYPKGVFDSDMYIRPYVKINGGTYMMGDVEKLTFRPFTFYESTVKPAHLGYYVSTRIDFGDDRGNIMSGGYVVGPNEPSLNSYYGCEFVTIEEIDWAYAIPLYGQKMWIYNDQMQCSTNLFYNYRGYIFRPFVEYYDGRVIYGESFLAL